MNASRPRIFVLADTLGWAWERKARAYQRHLGARYDITVGYQTHGLPEDLAPFDLIHLFEFPQVRFIPPSFRASGRKVVTGLTANVWRTWGRDRVRGWIAQADALHANSQLLVDDLRAYVLTPDDPSLFYCPNGVDPDFWWVDGGTWPDILVAGHVGKPNPRKGADLIIGACRAVGVQLRLVQRTSKLALSAVEMRNWYQGVSLQVTASNMDGTPGPMLEAAAAGRALLSTPIGNMLQVVESGVNGFLTSARLPMAGEPLDEGKKALQGELADRLAWCRDHYDQVYEMGLAARQTILDGWTWAQQVEYVDQLWRRALA